MSSMNVFTFNTDSPGDLDVGCHGDIRDVDLTNIGVAWAETSKAYSTAIKDGMCIHNYDVVEPCISKESSNVFKGNKGSEMIPQLDVVSCQIEDNKCYSMHNADVELLPENKQKMPEARVGPVISRLPEHSNVHSGLFRSSFIKYLAFIFILSFTSWTLTSAQVYPPLFNAAEEKDVSVDPPSNICGVAQSETFCKSSSDTQTLTSCWEDECTLSCPPTDSTGKLPYVELAFDRVRDGWGDCVYKVFDNLSPALPSANVQKFKAKFAANNNGTCYLDLVPEWMTILFLQPTRSITISVWIRPEPTTTESTIFEIGTVSPTSTVLRLGLTSALQLFITSKNQPQTSRGKWKLPENQWTHVSVQIYNETVGVFFNGTYASPTAYNVKFQPTRVSAKYRIGKSFPSNDFFKGDMQDFKIYTQSVSNRENMEIFRGELPSTRVMTNCRCPGNFPHLKPSDNTYCIANEGQGMPKAEHYRLRRNSYPLEFINDGKADSAWIGRVGVDRVTITVDLGTQYEVLNVKLLFYSPFPDTLKIERKQNTTKDWTVWQYFAHDCLTKFGLPANGPLNSESGVNCKPMINGNDAPASNGELVFDLLADRPGKNGSIYTYSLRQFLQASSIRITMAGYPFSSLPGKMYHGINEISVNSRCDCHGHGTACDLSGPLYVCTCDPNTYTKGRRCDECRDGTYQDTTKDPYSPQACKPCDCDVSGTRNGDRTCQDIGGQCNCKSNVGRRRCDTCKPGFHSIDPNDVDGCKMCDCDTAGTIGGSNICDVKTAQCPCKSHLTGLRCDQCNAGYYKKDDSGGSSACQSCECDSAGSVAGNSSCEQTTGQCFCKPRVTGRKCDKCKDGYYNLDSSNLDGCTDCSCDPDGSKSSTCNLVTGKCECRTNVVGRKCDQCEAGFYAKDKEDMAANGCSHSCSCSVNGTDPKNSAGCEKFGGQCVCKSNTFGRNCDMCKEKTYGFNSNPVTGCVPCDCDPRGIMDNKEECNVRTGQCECKSNVEGRRCDVCKEGAYGLNTGRSEGCRQCSCYIPGTIPGNICDQETGRCLCIEGAGDPAVTEFKCEPYITSIVPSYGPESGGTSVEIRGGFLGNINKTEIKVGSQICDLDINVGNHTSILCVTRTLHSSTVQEEVKGKELSLALNVGGIKAMAPDKFKYLEDPKITFVAPTQTFLEGGLVLTVSGSHLNSVYRPLMEVTMRSKVKGSEVFTSVCDVEEPDFMHCPTPTIEIPKELGIEGTRRRRSTFDRSSSDDEALEIHGRTKRSADDAKPINRDELQFYLGFILDGVTLYRDLSDTLPEFSVLKVFLNPEVERFEEDSDTDFVRVFQPYWPYNHKFVHIKGSRLNYAASASDYLVMIGSAKCKDLQLASNKITCTPPAMRPDVDPNAVQTRDEPSVVVTVGNIRVHVGWMAYEHTLWDNLAFRYGIIGGIAGLLLLIFLCICCCCCCCRKRKNKEADKEKHPNLELSGKGLNNAYISAYNGSQTSYMNPTMELLMLLPEDLQEKVQGCLIDFKRMELGKLIGQGHFGRVYVGRLSTGNEQFPVAIKTLREYHVTPRDVAYFLDEATIMKDLEHEHVLNLLGVVIENNKAYVILPYMENGDLKSFISNEENLLTVGELIKFGRQVAEGMSYLSKQKFVHRDLAARNCMVDRSLEVKIADFGLSREIYQSDYYKESDTVRPLPVKWMSYESLDKGLYTIKSDVWSFGVLLWELMTRGCTPYPDVDPFDMKVYLAHGNRMDKPDFAPNELYDLMLSCWQADPNHRPEFYEIQLRLGEILEGHNSTTTMRKKQEMQVRPVSHGHHTPNGYAEVTREMEY